MLKTSVEATSYSRRISARRSNHDRMPSSSVALRRALLRQRDHDDLSSGWRSSKLRSHPCPTSTVAERPGTGRLMVFAYAMTFAGVSGKPLQEQRRICSARAVSAAGVSDCMPDCASFFGRRPFIRCRRVASATLCARAAALMLAWAPDASSAAASCSRDSRSSRSAADAAWAALVRREEEARGMSDGGMHGTMLILRCLRCLRW